MKRAEIRWSVARAVLLTVIAFVMLIPVLATVLGGFKSAGELRVDPLGLPADWITDNYASILSTVQFWQSLANSAIIASFTVALTLIVSSMAAFSFSHIRFFGSQMVLNYLLLGLLFPVAVGILPLFIKLRDLGLLDSYFGVILPQVAFQTGMAVLLLRRAFLDLPKELWESARVDGCSYMTFYWKIVLPLAVPTLATVGVITLIASWNNYLLPLVVLNDQNTYPWPLGIIQFRGEYGTEWNLVLAYVSLTIVPAVLLYVLAQRYIIAGLTGGAVKG